jgi:hypothetical protein
MDSTPEKVRKHPAFRTRIDEQIKRDTFITADELRGHVMRDLLRWLVSQPPVVATMSRMAPVPSPRAGGGACRHVYRFRALSLAIRPCAPPICRPARENARPGDVGPLRGIGESHRIGQIGPVGLKRHVLMFWVRVGHYVPTRTGKRV